MPLFAADHSDRDHHFHDPVTLCSLPADAKRKKIILIGVWHSPRLFHCAARCPEANSVETALTAISPRPVNGSFEHASHGFEHDFMEALEIHTVVGSQPRNTVR